jgi:hypothetical protein
MFSVIAINPRWRSPPAKNGGFPQVGRHTVPALSAYATISDQSLLRAELAHRSIYMTTKDNSGDNDPEIVQGMK